MALKERSWQNGNCLNLMLNKELLLNILNFKYMTTQPFVFNKPKVIQALRYHFISRKEIKIMMILVNVFALVSASLYFFKKITPMAFMLSSLLWFLMMLVFWFLLPRMIYNKSASFKDTFSITINEDYFMLSHEKASKQFAWRDFSSWMESPHFFHLYINERSFFLIPKDAFINDQEVEARSTFKQKIRKQ